MNAPKIPETKLKALIERHQFLSDRLSENIDPDTLAELSKEYSTLGPVVEKAREFFDVREEQSGLEDILNDPESDAEMKALAEEEGPELSKRLDELAEELQVLLLPKDAADDKGAILEVRAGTGGDEAALFAGDLFRMYERYCGIHGWKIQVIDVSDGEVGGYKEIVAQITGKGVFARMKFESGVHRVQRVPDTESGGRIHTSAATVAVLPEAEEVDIEIRNEDIRIDTMRASGAGGQHVNTTDSAVRITHIPSGIVVMQAEKSQHQNRARAMQILRARLFDMERQKAASERAEERKLQVGSGDRSERIRTYNFPQGRVSDHRINLTLYKLDKILMGEALDELVDALITDHQAQLLAAQPED